MEPELILMTVVSFPLMVMRRQAYISMKKLPKLSQRGKGRAGIRSPDLEDSSRHLQCSGQPVFTGHLRRASSASQPCGKCGARSQGSMRICSFQK